MDRAFAEQDAVGPDAERMRLEAALRERDAWLREIHHRVKNDLQVISSLINLQLGRLEPGAGRDALQECSLRVLAIAQIHEQLYLSQNFERVPLAEYAQNLARAVFRATPMMSERVRLEPATEQVSIAVSAALPCGLILGELLTNALRHAFPDGRSGAVRIELSSLKDRVLLAVSDDGVGLPPQFDPARAPTLGMQLIHMLTAQLRGEFSAEPRERGSRFQLKFPIEED